MSIAVIIPYFQRTPGLLARAIGSVMAQKDIDDIHIVVVDDESPVSARSELATLGATPFPISLLEQANAGPAAARNRGLDAVASNARYVAFLDSDDIWSESHLAQAARSLDAGYDFYFSDFYQTGQNVPAFTRAGKIDVADHPVIGENGPTHAYTGDMFDQIITGNVIGTSTVVYNVGRFRNQRFDERFFSAGEDYLFWIDCARAGARFCFSSDIEAYYGYGINIYSGSGWGSEGHLRRIQNEMRYRKRLIDFGLDARQLALVSSMILKLRADFARTVLHRLSHRKSLPLRIVGTQLRLDPATTIAIWKGVRAAIREKSSADTAQ